MEITALTIHEARDLLRSGEITSAELTRTYLDRIGLLDPELRTYISVLDEQATAQAARADARLAADPEAPDLCGIPLALKDNLVTEGIPTTCASGILDGFIPPYDGTVVGKLFDAGAVLLGKTNMDEFAMGSSTENSMVGFTRNPWDRERVPGGSSGGSAAATAADLCTGAIGSDTGGSIRQPAAFCGVTGLKPTYGRVSRYGLVAFASSLDQIGPVVKDVTDCAILMNTISGYDPKDSTSVDMGVPDFREALADKVDDIVIGVPSEFFIEGIDPEVEASVRSGIDTFREMGAEIVDVHLPHTEYAVATYYLLATAEASSNLARYDGVRYGLSIRRNGENIADMYARTRSEGFGTEVKRRIMLGTYALSSGYYDEYYRKAQQVRTLIRHDFEEAFQKCTVLVTPTCPTAAFRIGERIDDPLTMYLGDIFTISLNLAGVPGMSLPCGFTSSGLPIGMQIIGKHFDESTILRAAFAYQSGTGHHLEKPAIDVDGGETVDEG